MNKLIENIKPYLNKKNLNEAEIVYLMVQIRKVIEELNDGKEKDDKRFIYLNFYCDWLLHIRLYRNSAQKILKHFDTANEELKQGKELHKLSNEFNNIIKLYYFKTELEDFLVEFELKAKFMSSVDLWSKFLSVYYSEIEKCPLIVSANSITSITKVEIKLDYANQLDHNYQHYKINWIISDKNGNSGQIYIINSYLVS